jgi:hypothetical protein
LLVFSPTFLKPDKQTKYPPSAVGGVAGGRKYVVNQIFIKFPIDDKGIYGGDDMGAAKTVCEYNEKRKRGGRKE